MKLFDCHMHCECSTDSIMTVQQAAAQAEKLGIGICVTEHWDYDYPTNPDAFHFDVNEYADNLAKYPKVLCGIEIGMQPHLAEKNRVLALSKNFDFVLCSIHCVKQIDIYEPHYYLGKTKQQVVVEYLTDMLTCIRNHTEIDALAHIDYIARYWKYNEELELSDAADLWDAVFKELAQREIPMEINTRRIELASAVDCYRGLLGRYKELGGKYITVGSDAHNVNNIGKRIAEAVAIGEELGLTPVYFKQRKKIPVR